MVPGGGVELRQFHGSPHTRLIRLRSSKNPGAKAPGFFVADLAPILYSDRAAASRFVEFRF